MNEIDDSKFDDKQGFDPTRKNRSVVVKITDLCNFSCEHCCFSCSPKGRALMSLETMKLLASEFADDEKTLWWFNIMGGEPTLHPRYEEMVGVLAGRIVRLTTNGWWIDHEKAKFRFMNFLKTTEAKVHVGVSRDKYHREGVGERAFDFLQSEKIADDWGLSSPDPDEEFSSIASVGRAWWNYIGMMLSTFGAYCQSSNTRHSSFTVLEDGTVTHCPFGIFPIGDISEGLAVLDEEKAEMVKRWKKAMPTCRSCYQFWVMEGRRRCIDNGFTIYNETSL